MKSSICPTFKVLKLIKGGLSSKISNLYSDRLTKLSRIVSRIKLMLTHIILHGDEITSNHLGAPDLDTFFKSSICENFPKREERIDTIIDFFRLRFAVYFL